jgi:tripartite-type tricarboxylate transporter receptor subunit TctC
VALAEQIGQSHRLSVIVENRPGGANVVAVQAVAHAAPDGNTVFIHSPALIITPQFQRASYDPFKLFDPICNLVNSPVIITVNDGPAVTALIGGHVTAMLGNFSSLSEQISAGKLRALAVGSRTRLLALPDVPTVVESGYKGYEVAVWFGAVAPVGTPKEKLAQLGEWFTGALQAPEVKTKLANQQLLSVATCGANYTAFLHNQYEAFGRIIHDARITE